MIIITYHNVLEHTPGGFHMLTRKESLLLHKFEKQIDDIAARYRVVPLAEVANAVREGTALPDACALTFDDGGLGGYRYAAPLLEERALPATFFVVTRRLDGGVHDAFDRLEALLWLSKSESLDLSATDAGMLPLTCDECKVRAYGAIAKRLRVASRSLRERLLADVARACDVSESAVAGYLSHEAYQSMDWRQAGDLAQRGFDIGSHTRTHISAAALSDAELEDEIGGSYYDVVEHTGPSERGVTFAYPFGKDKHISDAAVESVRKAGYSCAVVVGGEPTPGADIFRMGRMAYGEARRRRRT